MAVKIEQNRGTKFFAVNGAKAMQFIKELEIYSMLVLVLLLIPSRLHSIPGDTSTAFFVPFSEPPGVTTWLKNDCSFEIPEPPSVTTRLENEMFV